MSGYPEVPAGWSVVETTRTGPFTTGIVYERPDGRRVAWSWRKQRKHPLRLARERAGELSARDHPLWAPRRTWWWVAVLFAIGSTCFLVGPFPGFVDLVGPEADGWVFFVGSVFFTSAATMQWLETVNADRATLTGRRRTLRALAWEPHRIDWWSGGIQLIGTLFFNITTFRGLTVAADAASPYDKLVWRPDAYGSVCFLVSGLLAYAEVTGGLTRRPPRSIDGRIVAVNLFGCVAFAVSAVGAYVLPATDSAVNLALANLTTALGALGFLIGSVLLLPEGAGLSEFPR